MQPTPIDRVAYSSLEQDPSCFMREYVIANKPVVITGALGGWAALGWSPEALLKRSGPDHRVSVAPLQQNQGCRHAWLEPARLW